MSKSERKPFREEVREIRAKQVSDLERKRLAKLLKKTPPTAEWVVIQVQGDKEMRKLSGEGWEVVGFPDNSAWRTIQNRYAMRIARTKIEQQLQQLDNGAAS